MSVFLLPEEIWMHVFKYLSKSDRMEVRSCCKYFKRLVDHRSLWKDEIIVLRRIRSYNSNFWKTLRYRMLTAVVVVNPNIRECKQIVTSLPWLRSVTIDLSNVDSDVLTNLSSLRELKRLVIRSKCHRSLAVSKSLILLPQLEHLSVCRILNYVRSDIMTAISQLCNLTSLHYHEGLSPIPKKMFHAMLKSLPKLKHLSLRMWTGHGSRMWTGPLPDDYLNLSRVGLDSPDLHNGNNGLTSLELLNYMDPMLSPVALKHLPFLESLTVKYISRATEPSKCHLSAWLQSLAHLTELSVTNGHSFSAYASSLPRTLRTLSLTGMMVEPGAIASAGEKVPDILCLRYDPFVFNGPSSVAEIPEVFPLLQTLKVRSHSVSEKDLAWLGEMHQMKHLVILDARPGHCPLSSDLLSKLQDLTDNRVQVVLSGDAIDPAACFCNHY